MMKQYTKKTRTAFIPVVQILFFLLLPATLQAGDVTLAWDPNSETNLAGYKLYYDSDADLEMYQGTGASEGDSPVIIYLEDLADADLPTFTLTGLTNGQYYYFALTAFDSDGMESDFSDEVGTLVDVGGASNDGSSASSKEVGNDTSGSGSGGNGCFIAGSMDTVTSLPPALAAFGVLLLLSVAMTAFRPRMQKGRFPGKRS